MNCRGRKQSRGIVLREIIMIIALLATGAQREREGEYYYVWPATGHAVNGGAYSIRVGRKKARKKDRI